MIEGGEEHSPCKVHEFAAFVCCVSVLCKCNSNIVKVLYCSKFNGSMKGNVPSDFGKKDIEMTSEIDDRNGKRRDRAIDVVVRIR